MISLLDQIQVILCIIMFHHGHLLAQFLQKIACFDILLKDLSVLLDDQVNLILIRGYFIERLVMFLDFFKSLLHQYLLL